MSDNIQIDITTTVQNVDIQVTESPADSFFIEYFYPQGPQGVNTWGSLSGTLSAQSDLWHFLSAVGTSNFDIATLNTYLSTNSILLCSLNANGQILSAGVNLFDIFRTTDSDSQTLTYTPSSYLLSISNGNTVNLFSINSLFGSVSGKYENVSTVVQQGSSNWYSASATAVNVTNNFTQTNFLPLSGGTIIGNLYVLSSLYVAGSSFHVLAQDLIIKDPIIYIADDNQTDILDTGIMASWTNAPGYPTGYQHGGLVRRSDNKTWTLFSGATAEPLSGLNVQWFQQGIQLEPLSAKFYGDVYGNRNVFGSLGITNGLTVTGNISGNNLNASFNNGVATGNYSFAEGIGTIASGYASHAEGENTQAQGYNAHSEGNLTIASGNYSHAEGRETVASGNYSHVEGNFTSTGNRVTYATYLTSTKTFTFYPETSANFAYLNDPLNTNLFLKGYDPDVEFFTISYCTRNPVTGSITLTSDPIGQDRNPNVSGYLIDKAGQYAHAEGKDTQAAANQAHAEGFATIASGNNSHAEGESTQAIGNDSHAEGYGTKALSAYSHAEGRDTTAGLYAHVEGRSSSALGDYSHAQGRSTTATGAYSDASGQSTTASGQWSVASGQATYAAGPWSIAKGNTTIASGSASYAEGDNTTASGNYSHAEGYQTATGEKVQYATWAKATRTFTFSPASLLNTKFSYITPGTVLKAIGSNNAYVTFTVLSADFVTGSLSAASNVFSANIDTNGYIINNSGTNSHAEGYRTIASGTISHAEGDSTTASGNGSHAEGSNTKAAGIASHAAGYRATAAQDYTYAWSDGNLGSANQSISSTRTGQYMISASNGVFIPGKVGIGTDSVDNALTVVGTISTSNHGNSSQWNQAYNISTAYQTASTSFATNTTLNSVSSLLTPLTVTNTLTGLLTPLTTTNTLTGQLVLNTTFANTTATLLPTSVYQSASGNWQSTYTTVQSNSSNWQNAYANTSTLSTSISTKAVIITDNIFSKLQLSVATELLTSLAVVSAVNTYTSVATWICPTNVISVTAECWGGGGAGGGGYRTTSGTVYCGGGAGGGYAKSIISVTPGQTYYINIGAGGVATNPPVNGTVNSGGDTWFNSVNTSAGAPVIAKGGLGAPDVVAATGTVGTAGTWSSNTNTGNIVTYVGGNGSIGVLPNYAGGGGGGAGSTGTGNTPTNGSGLGGTTTLLSGGAGGNSNSVAGASGPGQPGSNYGGGGGGARASATAQVGGNGAQGALLLTYSTIVSSISSSVLIPAGSLCFGAVAYVLSTGTATATAFNINDSTSKSWGSNIGLTAGNKTNSTNYNLSSIPFYPSPTNFTITAPASSSFNNTKFQVTAYYLNVVNI